jgi:hypothetical protein
VFDDKTTITAAPLAIVLKDADKNVIEYIYRKDLQEAHGEKVGISYALGNRRQLEKSSVVNVLVINLTPQSFEADGKEIVFYEARNYKAMEKDDLAKALLAKYHENEPMFERIFVKKADGAAKEGGKKKIDVSKV